MFLNASIPYGFYDSWSGLSSVLCFTFLAHYCHWLEMLLYSLLELTLFHSPEASAQQILFYKASAGFLLAPFIMTLTNALYTNERSCLASWDGFLKKKKFKFTEYLSTITLGLFHTGGGGGRKEKKKKMTVEISHFHGESSRFSP